MLPPGERDREEAGHPAGVGSGWWMGQGGGGPPGWCWKRLDGVKPPATPKALVSREMGST